LHPAELEGIPSSDPPSQARQRGEQILEKHRHIRRRLDALLGITGK